jgi:phosphoglycolate phosphatase
MTITIPRALIFDWDNTLVDSWEAISRAINDVRAEFGKTTWNMAEIKTNCTRAARDSFPEWFGDEWQKAYEFYYRRFDEVRKESRIRGMPGAESLLKWLKTQSIPALVVSNKHGTYLRMEAGMLGWENLFAAIVGATDAPRDKPMRDPVDFALHKADIKTNDNVWFVGDSDIDMQCARNANCTPVFMGDAAEAARLSVACAFPDCHALQSILYDSLNNVVGSEVK